MIKFRKDDWRIDRKFFEINIKNPMQNAAKPKRMRRAKGPIKVFLSIFL